MTALAAPTPQFAQFMTTMSDDPAKTQVVQTVVHGMARYVSAMGQKASNFVKDVGGNLCKGAAASVIAGLLVAGVVTTMAPATPVAGALLAGSFAAKAAQSVVEAVVDTVIDNSIKVTTQHNKAAKPS